MYVCTYIYLCLSLYVYIHIHTTNTSKQLNNPGGHGSSRRDGRLLALSPRFI